MTTPSPYLLQWHIYQDLKPKLNQLVLVFRNKRKKYTVARLMTFKGPDTKEYYHWVTEYGTCHEAEPEDAWWGILPYSKKETYT